jgi:hypothetical protein
MPGPTLDVHDAAGSAARATGVGLTENAALLPTIGANRRCATRPKRTRASPCGAQSSGYGLGLGEGDAEGDAAGDPLGDGLGEGDGEGSGVQPGLPGVSSTVCSTPVTSTSFCW